MLCTYLSTSFIDVATTFKVPFKRARASLAVMIETLRGLERLYGNSQEKMTTGEASLTQLISTVPSSPRFHERIPNRQEELHAGGNLSFSVSHLID